MWFVFALLSAVFAALTSILAKVGIADIAVLSVDIAQDQIGGLAPHTGQ